MVSPSTGRLSRYAQVAVLARLGRAGGLYTYGLPEHLLSFAGPGSLVRVPFQTRAYQGVVCSIESESSLPLVRDVQEVLDPAPVVTPYQLQLARWMTEYYSSSLSDILGAMLPPGLDRQTVYWLESAADAHRETREPQRLAVMEQVKSAGRVTVDAVQRALPGTDVERVVASLVREGILVRIAELAPPRVKARQVRMVALTEAGRSWLAGGTVKPRQALQRAVLEYLDCHGPASEADISAALPGSRSSIIALRKKALVRVEFEDVPRAAGGGITSAAGTTATSPLALSPAQEKALHAVVRSVRAARPDIYLLHGVTGSGKTEVYLQAIQETILGGRQALMMVPEIALTPQAVERVAGRFPGKVAVLHSKLSDRERVEEWQRIRRGEVDVVVGARSALFAPLPRPGLIVVDEEHDASYKQDSSPRYNARDGAAVLGRLTGATVVLGSATPDVGTYHAATSGRIALLELPNRPVWTGTDDTPPRPMPSVEIVDLRQELKSGNRGMFSQVLLESLHRTLRDGHQALLFLNRRGSATVVLCRDCGCVVRCPHCDIPFTYHAAATRLICHRCDKRIVSPRICPACKSPRIRYLGVGTQRVEEEVAHLFPAARVLRWDRDVTGGRGAHEEILKRFARHEADILVGTQMIAKGLDFPLVTLVGVISADTGLHMPDFRAPERSFQLLTQVAGRAGRSSLPSRVVVQTYTPEHYAIQAARDHDYHRFYRDEMSFREIARYPPFARLIRFVYSSEQEPNCRQSAENLRAILERAIEEDQLAAMELIGPAPCFVARARNRYFWQVIARGERSNDLHRLLDYVPAGWAIDVDPVDLL